MACSLWGGHAVWARRDGIIAVQVAIPYVTLMELVKQLSDEKQRDLLRQVQAREVHESLADVDWRVAINALKIPLPVGAAFPLRRADWYDDDGR